MFLNYQHFIYKSLDFCWQSGFKLLEHKPVPFWVALFVEGTRFTHTKLLAAQEFAISRGIPVPKNVLIPRTKVKNIDTQDMFGYEKMRICSPAKEYMDLKIKNVISDECFFATSSLYIADSSNMINCYLNNLCQQLPP